MLCLRPGEIFLAASNAAPSLAGGERSVAYLMIDNEIAVYCPGCAERGCALPSIRST